MASGFALVCGRRHAGHANRDRAEGFVPAVMYGHTVESVALRVEAHELGGLIAHGGAHRLIQLSVDGEDAPHTVVIKEIQRHPVTRRVVHVDFQAVSARERIHAEVPLRLVGEDAVAKAGGILQVLLHALRITCLPADLPDRLEVDVSELRIGDALAVGQIRVAETVTLQHEANEIVASVLAPRTAEPEKPEASEPVEESAPEEPTADKA